MAGSGTFITLACISIILYGALSGVSAYYYFKFRAIMQDGAQYSRTAGRYDEPKVLFFLVLMISGFFELPAYVGCLVHDGPRDCEWDSYTYPIFWVFHLLAVIGYAFSITIPCVMWSDMMNRKDGKLFFSAFPYDSTKRFFQICIVTYVLNTAVDLVAIGISFRSDDHNHFTDNSDIDGVCTLIEPFIIFFIACGCLWCGIRLQNHVVKAKLNFGAVVRVLFYLNMTMIIICVSYLARAILVMKLVNFLPNAYAEAFKMSYFVWLLCTRWIPHVVCSFSLVYLMRSSGSESAAKNLPKDKHHAHHSHAHHIGAGSDGDSLVESLHSSGRNYAQVIHVNDMDDERINALHLSSSLSSDGFEDEDEDEESLLSGTDLPWRPFAMPSVDQDTRTFSVGDIYAPRAKQPAAYSPPRVASSNDSKGISMEDMGLEI